MQSLRLIALAWSLSWLKFFDRMESTSGKTDCSVGSEKNGYLCSKGEYYNQPTQKAMEAGLFEVKKTSIAKPDGSVLVTTTTKVTGKGQIFFVDKFLSQEVA